MSQDFEAEARRAALRCAAIRDALVESTDAPPPPNRPPRDALAVWELQLKINALIHVVTSQNQEIKKVRYRAFIASLHEITRGLHRLRHSGEIRRGGTQRAMLFAGAD